ncbi:MAG TPA: hypothetical protein VL970_09235, partial [Candidatus Acidoferrales bacterium]|nr:hypothetical protein [Candidatus Acidoferrales bacterium]
MQTSIKFGVLAMLWILDPLGILTAQSNHPELPGMATKPTSEAERPEATLVNFGANGQPITRFDSVASAIDAHDGEIAYFHGVFYL